MKFCFENFAYFDKAEIELGQLTIICGTNNVGKTYLNYGIYGFLSVLNNLAALHFPLEFVRELLKNGSLVLDLKEYEQHLVDLINDASKSFTHSLDNLFSSPVQTFAKTSALFLSESLFPIDYSASIVRDIVQANEYTLSVQKEAHRSELELSISLDGDSISMTPLQRVIKRQIIDALLQNKIRKPFVITAERTGIALFQKELDINKNVIFEQLNNSKNVTDLFYDVFHETISRYPITIKNNIDLIRDLENIRKRKSFYFDEFAQEGSSYKTVIQKNLSRILGGNFKQVNGDTYFVPGKEKHRQKVDPLPMYMSSSSVKSMLLLDVYIRHLASPKDILIIDEPELNLHPLNQRLMAHLLAQIVNSGVHVLITTHSDFLVKELNHLIMLSNDFKDRNKLMKQFSYSQSEVLKPSQVKVYLASEEHTLEPVVIDEMGIQLESFDTVILDQGDVSNALSFALDS